MATATKDRSIDIEHRNGTHTVVSNIPGNARITFGPVQPGGKGYSGPGENVLRIYTTQNNQLAVFRDVACFRDLSLRIHMTEITYDEESTEVKSPKAQHRSKVSAASQRLVEVALPDGLA